MEKLIDMHIHTTYSDGEKDPEEIIEMAEKNNIKTIAITDHGVMFGAVNFYKACQKEGIKPIIGCEAYVAPRTRFEKEAGIDDEYFHLTLLCKNKKGY